MKKTKKEIPAKEIFTCHPHGGYFSTSRQLLLKDYISPDYKHEVFVYKFSHVEIVTKKTELSIKRRNDA